MNTLEKDYLTLESKLSKHWKLYDAKLAKVRTNSEIPDYGKLARWSRPITDRLFKRYGAAFWFHWFSESHDKLCDTF